MDITEWMLQGFAVNDLIKLAQSLHEQGIFESLENVVFLTKDKYAEVQADLKRVRTEKANLMLLNGEQAEELQAWRDKAEERHAFHLHIVEQEKKLTKLGTANKYLERARERLEEYRLSEEFEDDDSHWYMDASVFAVEVNGPGGILEQIYEEITGEKYEDA